VFEVTGIHDMGLRFAEPSALSIPDTVVHRSYLAHREAIETAMLGTQLLGVRSTDLSDLQRPTHMRRGPCLGHHGDEKRRLKTLSSHGDLSKDGCFPLP
jgi:hypothetical protein